jgi:hypothetical protein
MMTNTGSQTKAQELQTAFLSASMDFEGEINLHLDRFVKGSRSWVTARVREWMESSARMFRRKADAGMGKSAFAAHMIREMKASGRLVASFFCKNGQKTRPDGESVLMRLAYQIALSYPECHEKVANAAKSIREEKSLSLEDKFQLLVAGPSQMIQRSEQDEQNDLCGVIVIDALDEIGVYGSEDRIEFLNVLARKLGSMPKWAKLLVTIRPEADIVSALNKFEPQQIDADDPNHISNLKTYIRSEVKGHLKRSEHEDAACGAILPKEPSSLDLHVSDINIQIISGSYDQAIKIWDVTAEAGNVTLPVDGHNAHVSTVNMSSDGKRIISASGDRTIKIWNAATRACEITFEENLDQVLSIAMSIDSIDTGSQGIVSG